LERLGDLANTLLAVWLQESNRSFQSVDFWRTSRFSRVGMLLAFAGACGEAHSREIIDTVWRTLVGSNTNIALVVIAIRPQTIGRCKITRAGEIAHGPETRPETNNVTRTGQ
jgi:hypothetical protein